MARLPSPGSDSGTWGTVLNDFLGVSHAADGTLTTNTVGDAQVSGLSLSKVTGLSAALSDKANNTSVVHLTTDETVAGVKTFSSSPIVPTPTTGTQATTKEYVDSNAAYTVQRITSATTASTSRNQFFSVNAAGGPVTVTLPAIGSVPSGRKYEVKKVDASANAVTVAGSSIDGATTAVINTQYEALTIVSDGVEWLIL